MNKKNINNIPRSEQRNDIDSAEQLASISESASYSSGLSSLVDSHLMSLYYKQEVGEERMHILGAVIAIDRLKNDAIKDVLKEIISEEYENNPILSPKKLKKDMEDMYNMGYLDRDIRKKTPKQLHKILRDEIKKKYRLSYSSSKQGTIVKSIDDIIISKIADYNSIDQLDIRKGQPVSLDSYFGIKTEQEKLDDLDGKSIESLNRIWKIIRWPCMPFYLPAMAIYNFMCPEDEGAIIPGEKPSMLNLAYVINLSSTEKDLAEEIAEYYEGTLKDIINYEIDFEDNEYGYRKIIHLISPKENLIKKIIRREAIENKVAEEIEDMDIRFNKKLIRNRTIEILYEETIKRIIKNREEFSKLDATPFSKLSFADSLYSGFIYVTPYSKKLIESPPNPETEECKEELEKVISLKKYWKASNYKRYNKKNYQVIVVRAKSREELQEMKNRFFYFGDLEFSSEKPRE